MPDPVIGIHPNISRREYEQIDAANISMLQHFERSDLHGRDKMLHPPAPTKAMELGTAFHMAVLEPERFDAAYVVPIKCDRRTTEGKAAWAKFEAENAGRAYLEADAHQDLIGMRESVWARPISQALLRGRSLKEVAVVWREEETGIICKGLLDLLTVFDGWTWIIDLKSTVDASPEGFAREIRKHQYGAKAAFYFDGCNAVAPRDRRFGWIAVENERPYAAAEYEADESALNAGRSKYMRWLRRYAEAKATGVYQGYPDAIQPMTSAETEWRS